MVKRDKATKGAKGARTPPNAARSTTAPRKKPAGASVSQGPRKRSGGLVDAPGKTHRRPMPTDPGGTLANSQAAKMRTAMPMEKTSRRRGRG